MEEYRNKVFNVDCREGLKQLPDASIDCAITSPPYWSLRDYKIESSIWDNDPNCQHDFNIIKKEINMSVSNKNTLNSRKGAPKGNKIRNLNGISEGGFCSKCGAWKGVLGLEPSFELYIKHLCDIYDLVWRVLKPTGTNWVNLGDSHNGSGGSGSKKYFQKGHVQFGKIEVEGRYVTPRNIKSYPTKCLLMLPYRFAIEMCDRGWILRNVIIWHKKNCMPSSARDRFTVDFEPIFFFTKSKKYWFDQDAVREKSNGNSGWVKQRKQGIDNITPYQTEGNGKWAKPNIEANINGRNKRCVWSINTVGNPESHFATFPLSLVKPMILSGCPKEVCNKCGKSRERIVEIIRPIDYDPSCIDEDYHEHCLTASGSKGHNRPLSKMFKDSLNTKREMKGYSNCGCNEGHSSGIVLDIFAGTGTTLLQAWKLGRDFVGFEISKEYCDIIERRLKSTKNKRLTDFV